MYSQFGRFLLQSGRRKFLDVIHLAAGGGGVARTILCRQKRDKTILKVKAFIARFVDWMRCSFYPTSFSSSFSSSSLSLVIINDCCLVKEPVLIISDG
jgi:hypothetical protein